jgi:D-2-hydroxyacid dehydrogenase (NADP+)
MTFHGSVLAVGGPQRAKHTTTTGWEPAMTNVLFVLEFFEKQRKAYHDGVANAFPDITVYTVEHVRLADLYLAKADVLITFGPHLRDRAEHVLREAKRLKWIQALGTGVDNIADRTNLRDDIILTNIHGIHGAAISEAALTAMLNLSRHTALYLRNQEQRTWKKGWPCRLIEGKTVGIFGIGAIAKALAPRCKAIGMRVLGISSVKRAVAGFDQVYGRDELKAAVGSLDHLVVLTPYTPETHHIINADILSAMKPTCTVINLARGGVIDEEALVRALHSNTIAGAALDVFSKEPLPADHPLWSMPNVMITPHVGGFYEDYVYEALKVINANMRQFLAGNTANMVNVVKR